MHKPSLSRRALLTGAAGTLALGVVGSAALAAPAAAITRPVGRLSPPAGAWFGALCNRNRADASSTLAEVAEREAWLGRPLDIVHHFYSYNQALGTQGEAAHIAAGRIPLVTWGATSTAAIINGSQDAFLRTQAGRLKALGGALGTPVFLRYFHEPDGDYRKPLIPSPESYIQAYRHAHGIFQEEGATNVVWVFGTTAWKFRTPNVLPQPPAYYPGDDVVDWVGASGYNWAPAKPQTKWVSLRTTFGSWYNWASTLPKPLMMAEYGCQDDPAVPDRKAAWFAQAQVDIETHLPLVQAVVYWDTTNIKAGITYKWDLDSSSSALAAWCGIGQAAYFNPAGLP